MMDELLGKLIEELETAADRTHMAQSLYHQAVLNYEDKEETLKNHEILLKAKAAADPELKNDTLRNDYVLGKMMQEPCKTHRRDLYEAKEIKLSAQAEYDFRRRRQADLRAIVQALTKD